MRALTSKDGVISSHVDKIDESQVEIKNTSLKHHLGNNHDVAANKGKIKSHLPLEHIFGFCESFKRITEHLGFHETFKAADRQDFIYTTVGFNSNVFSNKLFLFVPKFIPDAETQTMFNDFIRE